MGVERWVRVSVGADQREGGVAADSRVLGVVL